MFIIDIYICLVYRRWLDKLGLAAKLGLDVVIRQVLIGSGTYHLVDDNLDPLPVSVFYVFHLCCITSVSVQECGPVNYPSFFSFSTLNYVLWQDYWLSLLYKRLVGPEVLKAQVLMNSGGPKKPIRVYLHCTNRKRYLYSRSQWFIF